MMVSFILLILGINYHLPKSLKGPDDPAIRQMIEDSEKDIKNGKVYSTDDMIEAIKLVNCN
ncbi:hypothetical protein FU659_14690 [Paenibacillus sp. N3.4]|nr:hypothetical protein FU659_14690 [Paenibacillus sp. N3.4]